MIDHNINGYLYTPGDEKKMSILLKRFQSNKADHKKFGENARSKVVKNFNRQYFLQIKNFRTLYLSSFYDNIHCRK